MRRNLLALIAVLLSTIALFWVFVGVRNLDFNKKPELAVLTEANTPEESTHQFWWVESGGFVTTGNDGWKTIRGALPSEDIWRKSYLRRNPLDTASGYYPQNVFRLLSKEIIPARSQELYFTIDEDRISSSPNRNESSGIFVLSRYGNVDNFYQIGIQVNGNAVVKKKYNGLYHTLAESKILLSEYNEETKESLLPKSTKIGIKTEFEVIEDTLLIKLYIDQGEGWSLALETEDNGDAYGPVLPDGRIGIKSDFMDLNFIDYLLDSESALSQAAN
jgi:hypothetical protein